MKIEILAPVGGEEQLKAAVRTGAGAVYFGLPNFNARRNADNFAGEKLPETIGYCHSHGVKVNITINTLVMDEELSEMHKAVDTAAMAGADAIIVQDLAVARYAKDVWPELPLHASTQMAISSINGVEILERYGFSRIVLARELSLEEIREIRDRTGAELEVFVHGAHCMSVSGNCYLSAMIGGRSGNRGLCAQSCRLDWRVDGEAGSDHALSLKDLSYIKHVRQLEEAGICSLKIEGRMKRAEYVAAAVTACRDALEGRKPDLETLQAVFSRSGFTDGYLTGKRDRSMFGYRTKEDVVAAAPVLGKLAELYRKEPQNVPVDMELRLRPGEDTILSADDGERKVVVTGAVPEAARTLPLSEESARRSLEKTGGTQYRLDKLTADIGEGLTLPSSALNDLRRRALEALEDYRSEGPEYHKHEVPDYYLPEYEAPGSREIRLRFESADQFFDPGDWILCSLPLSEIIKHKELISDSLICELPAVIYPMREDKILDDLKELKEAGLRSVLAENVAWIRLGKLAGLAVHGGASLNILNSASLEEYRAMGLEDAVVSFELAFSKFRKLEGSCGRGAITYGRLPLMRFRSCPARGLKGCGSCSGRRSLTDRMNETFPLLCREKQYSELLNCVPLYVGDRKLPPMDFEVLWFTTESRAECEKILEMYVKGEPAPFRRTAGLYYRELL